MQQLFSDEDYKALMSFVMASDPSPVDYETDQRVRDILDREATRRGYDSWYVAYHEMPIPGEAS